MINEKEKPTKVRIELDLELRYTETLETRKALASEIAGVKEELLSIIDEKITPIVNEKVNSVEMKMTDKRLFFVYP